MCRPPELGSISCGLTPGLPFGKLRAGSDYYLPPLRGCDVEVVGLAFGESAESQNPNGVRVWNPTSRKEREKWGTRFRG